MRQWLVLAKAFEAGMGIREAAALTATSRSTACRAFRVIRLSLAAQDPLWLPLLPALAEDDVRGRPMIFGISREGEGVAVRPLEPGPWSAPNPADILHADGFLCSRGNLEFDLLVYTGRLHAARPESAGRKDALSHPFLAYMLSRCAAHFGVSPAAIPLYLKEWEFRFNHAGRPLLDIILGSLARPRPDSAQARP